MSAAPPSSPLRVGIDVGGTFTDVVAVDATSGEVVARIKVPTSHAAADGVAAGIVAGLQQLLATDGVAAERIAFLAHSTTQATNALLEGDVARVGVVGLAATFDALGRNQLRVPPIALGAGAALRAELRFATDAASMRRAVDALLAAGAEAVVASEPFGVDHPAREAAAVAYARERGAAATAGYEVAGSYGLRARTRTAILNAAILPRMLHTSGVTAEAARRAGVGVPLMIMRSDGGVMDVREVAKRPILTMLSGPAAGIAGALLHENVSDGIFIEVGGTSADISVIRRGQPQLRAARVGGHRTLLRTLDVRTLGVAGGSLIRVDPQARGVAAVRDVGPRSAHIAGLRYACFLEADELRAARVVFARAHGSTADDHVTFESAGGAAALTPTCVANALGYVPASAFARAGPASAQLALALVARELGCEPEALGRAILEHAARKVRATIAEIVREYELDAARVELIGGGGGAAALVPFVAETLGVRHRLARDAEVISPIGVALALVRDSVERTIPGAGPDDVLRVRREAIERVIVAGADPSSVETAVEIDTRRNLVRATATGATRATARTAHGEDATDAAREAALVRATGAAPSALAEVARAGEFRVYEARVAGVRRWFGTGVPSLEICALDRRAVVRVHVRDALVASATADAAEALVADSLERATAFGDVGRALPEIFLLYGSRVVDLGALAEADQVRALVREELSGLDPAAPIAVIAARRKA